MVKRILKLLWEYEVKAKIINNVDWDTIIILYSTRYALNINVDKKVYSLEVARFVDDNSNETIREIKTNIESNLWFELDI